jgi:integration host factor subunit alpha
MALTKAQIVEMIAEQNGFAKNKNIELVENLLEIIKRTLENGEDVRVSGFLFRSYKETPYTLANSV